MDVVTRAWGEARRFLIELGHLGPLALLLVLLPFAGLAVLVAEADALLALLQSAPLALPLFAAASIVCAALSFVPTHAVSLLAGYVWGGIPGSLLALGIITVAAVLGHSLLARLAGNRLLRALAERPRARVLHEVLLQGGARRRIGVVALLRLSPVMPFAGTNLLMAAAAVPAGSFALGSLLGLAPRVCALAIAGAELQQIDFADPGSRIGAWLGLAGSLIGLVAITHIARRALRERLGPAPAGEPVPAPESEAPRP